jgi:hypothetical protein
MSARRHRHHKKPAADISVVSARHERRKALLAKAAESCALPESDLRIESLSWALLALDAEKQRLLRGEAGSISLWQDVCNRLQGLCPKSDTLRIHWIYECNTCKAQSETDPEPGPPPTGKPAHAFVGAAGPAPQAVPEPVGNVVKLEPPKITAAMVAAVNSPASLPAGQDSRNAFSRFDT